MASSHPPLDSPDHSSPESFEVEDDSNQASSAQWPMQAQTSPDGTPLSPSQAPRTAPPLQKRRRVTRACDECRRKKIKCDGKQPCTHCTVYSYDCTYDQPSNRRRNPAPQYIEALENRLQRAEALLRKFIPDIDLKDPNFDSLLHQRQASLGQGSKMPDSHQPDMSVAEAQDDSQNDAHLRSMIESTGQLDLDERGDWDFHGGSSGAVFLRRMRENFGGLLGGDSKAPFLPRPPRPKSSFDSPRSMDSLFENGLPNTSDLPTKENALLLCDCALNRACSLLRFVHGPSFYEMFDRIYATAPENFTDEENRFLPLLYVVLALGCMFTDHLQETQHPEEIDYKAGIEKGYKYFRAARSMMEITECRDITSLQAILFMILFLQASSNLSTCYSYIGVALRSAVRMGMHRNLIGKFNPVERETRRRVFWIIRKMDTYVAALLGFPKMLSDEDIDQVLPMEVDDEYITKDAILPMPAGKLSVYVASNAHTRLMAVLAKVIAYIYPLKGIEQSVQPASNSTYVVSYAKIREIEGDLKDWLDKLPMVLRPSEDESEDVVRVQQLLRMAYAHVQMMLYRPFLHYISGKCHTGKSIGDDRSYACAAAGISVSRNIVHITVEMKKRGVLIGAYWFTMYTTFFAILSLAFFVAENPDKPGTQEIFKDAISGKDALQGLAKRSQAADRCNTALNVLFEKLPEKLKQNQTEGKMPKKKRSASSLNPLIKRESRSSPDINNTAPPVGNVQRSTTFPARVETTTAARQSASFGNTRHASSGTSDQKWRRSTQDLGSPVDISSTVTPDSTGSSNGLQTQMNLQQPFGDLGAMMFPSADPFAYPNQAMMSFDTLQQKPGFMSNSIDTSVPNMFIGGGGNISSPYDNLEVQLFGPLPPYLMQTQPGMDMSQMNMSGIPGFNPQEMRAHTGLTPGVGANVNFDDFFAGGNDEWNSMLGDQVYMQ